MQVDRSSKGNNESNIDLNLKLKDAGIFKDNTVVHCHCFSQNDDNETLKDISIRKTSGKTYSAG